MARARGRPTLANAWGRARTPAPKRDLKKVIVASRVREVGSEEEVGTSAI